MLPRRRAARSVVLAVAALSTAATAWQPRRATARPPVAATARRQSARAQPLTVRRAEDPLGDTLNPEPEIDDVPAAPETALEVLLAAEKTHAEAFDAQSLDTPAQRAAKDEDDPLSEFDWEAHLGRVEEDAEAEAREAAAAETAALGAWDADDAAALASPPLLDDEPDFLKPRWDEVDPALYAARA